jgi:hypothetical protein
MDFKDLVAKVGAENLTYGDLLLTKEWQERRLQILQKDDNYCTECGLSATVWYEGKLISFDKNNFLDIEYDGERITADSPVTLEKNVYLHVHHKFYVRGRLPWEYQDEELTTLCNWCHWELHKTVKIKIFQETEKILEELNYYVCERCHGAGVFPEFSHVHDGICFRCNGARYEELIGKPKSNWIK